MFLSVNNSGNNSMEYGEAKKKIDEIIFHLIVVYSIKKCNYKSIY